MLSFFFLIIYFLFLGLDIQGVSTYTKKTFHVHTEYMWPFMLGKEWMWQKWWTSRIVHNGTLLKIYSSITILLQTVPWLQSWHLDCWCEFTKLESHSWHWDWNVSFVSWHHEKYHHCISITGTIFFKSITIANEFLKWSSCTTTKSYL